MTKEYMMGHCQGGYEENAQFRNKPISVLIAIFQMDLGLPVPERLHSGFYRS